MKIDFIISRDHNCNSNVTMAVLPPAPNWFSAQILRSSDDGHVAFGAKNSVVVLQCKPKAHFVGEKKTCDNPETTHSKADGKL